MAKIDFKENGSKGVESSKKGAQEAKKRGHEQNTRTITIDVYDEANLRLSCATAILAIIEADAHGDNELGMASWVIGEALHGVGLMIKDARDLLGGGAV